MATVEICLFLFVIAIMTLVGFAAGAYWYIPKLGETDFNMKETENDEKH